MRRRTDRWFPFLIVLALVTAFAAGAGCALMYVALNVPVFVVGYPGGPPPNVKPRPLEL